MTKITRQQSLTAPLLLIVDGADTGPDNKTGFLKGLGWEVVEAASFTQAIDLCSSRRYDVIFANLSILEGDGGTAIQAFRRANPEGQSTTIIAFSNEDQPPLTNPSDDPHIDLFIDHPIKNQHLPVYIALASTRRIEKHSRFRNVAQVQN